MKEKKKKCWRKKSRRKEGSGEKRGWCWCLLVIPALIFPLELIRVWRETNHKTLKTNRVETGKERKRRWAFSKIYINKKWRSNDRGMLRGSRRRNERDRGSTYTRALNQTEREKRMERQKIKQQNQKHKMQCWSDCVKIDKEMKGEGDNNKTNTNSEHRPPFQHTWGSACSGSLSELMPAPTK